MNSDWLLPSYQTQFPVELFTLYRLIKYNVQEPDVSQILPKHSDHKYMYSKGTWPSNLIFCLYLVVVNDESHNI